MSLIINCEVALLLLSVIRKFTSAVSQLKETAKNF